MPKRPINPCDMKLLPRIAFRFHVDKFNLFFALNKILLFNDMLLLAARMKKQLCLWLLCVPRKNTRKMHKNICHGI